MKKIFFLFLIGILSIILYLFCTSTGKVGVNRVLIKKECVNLAKEKKLKGGARRGFVQKCVEQKIKKRKRNIRRQKKKRKKNENRLK